MHAYSLSISIVLCFVPLFNYMQLGGQSHNLLGGDYVFTILIYSQQWKSIWILNNAPWIITWQHKICQEQIPLFHEKSDTWLLVIPKIHSEFSAQNRSGNFLIVRMPDACIWTQTGNWQTQTCSICRSLHNVIIQCPRRSSSPLTYVKCSHFQENTRRGLPMSYRDWFDSSLIPCKFLKVH